MLKPYEKYQNTEYDWLGPIPMHWQWLYLSQTCTEKQIKNTGNIEKNVLSLSYGKIVPRKNIDFGLAPKDYTSYQIVDKDNIILRLTDLQNDHKSLRTGLVKERGIITSAYTCLKPFRNTAYLQYLLHSYDTQKVFYGMGGGVRQSIGYKDIRNMRIPFPPREEQDQIVRFLDWKLAKINKLIRAKKKQIVLLNEQKQVIINHVVIRGLDPNVPMKDSEVEGLGLVPKHWQFYQLGKVAKIILSGLDKKTYEGQQPVLLCNYVDVYKNDYITDGLSFMKATASDAELATLKVFKDDVIITKDSESWDDIGVPAYVAQEIENLYCGYHLAILRTNKSIMLGEFLYNAFRSQYVQIQHKVKAKGVTRFSLGYQPIHDTLLLIPTIEEQEAIVEKIRNVCYIQDAFIEKIKKEIELLLEYKTSLISSVVTGKVDVRGINVPEFEYVVESVDEDGIEEAVAQEYEMGEE